MLQALEWSERTALCATLPMRRIATATLGGNDDLAAKVLADLDLEGCVRTEIMGWSSGWLTSKGRALTVTSA
ncbi:MAG: hypothetical protein DMF83_11050 [Acidobacteria bacterium]|nr:MAG: hypothetical protein DMF83_11050 [Acidobacteriota bacterium]